VPDRHPAGETRRDTPGQLDLSRPGVVWLRGEAIPIELTGTDRAIARLSPNPGHLTVGGRGKAQALAAIDRWYRREARTRIEPVVTTEGIRLGLRPTRIRIGAQRTRWGSCSTSGTLSFNWRLVIGGPEALRYVVIHELVHLEHHNHSRRFWAALAEAMPEWKDHAGWLRANERALLTWRPGL